MRNLCFVGLFILASLFSYSCQHEQAGEQTARLIPFVEERAAKLGRGLVVLPVESEVFVSWRMLPEDTEKTTYTVYRRELGTNGRAPTALTKTSISSFIDGNIQQGKTYAYSIGTILETHMSSGAVEMAEASETGNSTELRISPEVTVKIPNFDVTFRRNISGKKGLVSKVNYGYGDNAKMSGDRPADQGFSALVYDLGMDYKHVQVVTGDLTGDGDFEVLVKHSNNWDVDPWEEAWQPSEDTYKVSAFAASGKLLWRIDLGWGIESGVFYSPMVVWDLDGDGRSEVLLKTNKSSDPKDYSSERISVLDGASGKIINEAKWPSTKGLQQQNYNSNSRNYIAVAHLDGENPYIITARGLYKHQRILAYDNKLQKVWERTICDGTHSLHSLPVVDINDDGKEEIMWGEHCIGEGGLDLWTIEERMPYNGHPDICFVADIIPWNKGKEVFYCREGWYKKQHEDIGLLVANNKGEIIWARWNFRHVDGGWISKVIPDTEGMQMYSYDISGKMINEQGIEAATIDQYLWSADGKLLAEPDDMWMSFPVDWDGDGVREVCLRNGTVKRFGGAVVAKLDSGAVWGADVFGDHREEIVVAPQDGKVYIYFNTDVMRVAPRITPLDDRQYRNDVSRTAMQMNAIPFEGGLKTSQILRDAEKPISSGSAVH